MQRKFISAFRKMTKMPLALHIDIEDDGKEENTIAIERGFAGDYYNVGKFNNHAVLSNRFNKICLVRRVCRLGKWSYFQ